MNSIVVPPSSNHTPVVLSMSDPSLHGSMFARRTWFNFTSLTLGLAFLYIPIVIIVLFSFNQSSFTNVWSGFSLRWYVAFGEDEALMRAALNSLLVAVVSATIATILGTAAGICWARLRSRVQRIQKQISLALLILPDSVIGLSLLLFFIAIGWSPNLVTLVIAHATIAMCYVALIIEARLAGVNLDLEEAATDLGCPPHRVFFLVTLPVILPSVIAGWALAFITSLDEFIVAMFVTGSGGTTLPVEIFSRVRIGVTPAVNAIFTVTIGGATLLMALVSLGQHHQRRKQMLSSLLLSEGDRDVP